MTKVAIIGGGAAGIVAAHTLLSLKSKFQVVLLEAQPSYGGRTQTERWGSYAFDMGAQAIQDPSINPWTKIATKLELDAIKVNMPKSTYWVKNNDDQWVDANNRDEFESIRDKENEYRKLYDMNKKKKNLSVVSSEYYHLNNQYDLLGIDQAYLSSLSESAEPNKYLASDLARQDQERNEEDDLWLPLGIGNLIKKYGDRLDLVYASQYTSYFEACVNKITKGLNRKFTIGYKKLSSQIEIDDVDSCILTIPVNQISKINFEPELSINERIKYLKLGSYKKVFLEITSSLPINLERNQNYFLPDTKNLGLWEYYLIPNLCAQQDKNILLMRCGGTLAAVMDQLNDTDLMDAITMLMQEIYGNQFTFNLIMSSNWTDNQYIQGAYSYTTPRRDALEDDDEAFKARQVLINFNRDNQGNGLFFAGEALYTKQYGTIEGAYKTGKAAAIKVIEYLKKIE